MRQRPSGSDGRVQRLGGGNQKDLKAQTSLPASARAGVTEQRARSRSWAFKEAVRAESGRHAPRMMRFLPALIISLGGAAAGLWLLFVAMARLAGSELSPWNPGTGDLASTELFDVTRSAATAAGVLGAVFAILYAYRKQRVEEADGERKDSELLSKRFQDAANQIGHDRPPVRLAGVYAMSKLADDWQEQRQECVDVLCAYLRLPSQRDATGAEVEGDEVVRRAILDQVLLKTRRSLHSLQSWSELRLDLSGIDLNDLDVLGCSFADLVLDRATVRGDVHFFGTAITGRLSARDLTVSGSLGLGLAGAGSVNLWGLTVETGGCVSLGTETPESTGFSQPGLTVQNANIAPGGRLSVHIGSGAPKGHVSLRGSAVQGELSFYGKGDECAPAAISIGDLSTSGDGRVGFQKELLKLPGIIKPNPQPSPTLKLMQFEVGDWEIVDND